MALYSDTLCNDIQNVMPFQLVAPLAICQGVDKRFLWRGKGHT